MRRHALTLYDPTCFAGRNARGVSSGGLGCYRSHSGAGINAVLAPRLNNGSLAGWRSRGFSIQ